MDKNLRGVEDSSSVDSQALVSEMPGCVRGFDCLADVCTNQDEYVTNWCISSSYSLFPCIKTLLTGYKLRKHIAKALSAWSQAIRTALDRYNDAAAAMKPKKPLLSWENVVEYAFLQPPL